MLFGDSENVPIKNKKKMFKYIFLYIQRVLILRSTFGCISGPFSLFIVLNIENLGNILAETGTQKRM